MTAIEKVMGTLEDYKIALNGLEDIELIYYRTFLIQTDYITSKLAEGVATKEEYAEELEAREFARSEIRRLGVK